MNKSSKINENRRYVAYYRISVENKNSIKKGRSRDESLGIDAQKHIVQHFFHCEHEFTEIKSGKSISDRPILQKAMEYCKKNNAFLVCAKQDRLSRSVDDCRLILEQLKGKLILCDIPGEKLDLFSLTLYAAFSERERMLISLRTSQALQRKLATEGKWQQSNPAFKNGAIGKIGTATIQAKARSNDNNKAAASIVCVLKTAGKKYTEIMEHLNQNGFKTSTGKHFINISQVHRLYTNFCIHA